MTPLRGPLRKKESHLWEREVADHYVEPSWLWDRLFAMKGWDGLSVYDPACGFGTIVRAADSAGLQARGTDLIARWEEPAAILRFPTSDLYLSTRNFLDGKWALETGQVDAIVCNPPFAIAKQFVRQALSEARTKVAMLLPANWVQGKRRARWLATTPLHKVLFVCPRPSMPPGHIILEGGRSGGGKRDYAVFVWLKGYDGTPEIGWLHRDEA